MHIVGIDLSGPSNSGDTVVAALEKCGKELELRRTILAAADPTILESISELTHRSRVAVGIDAPLSYNVGGGDRPADSELRKLTIEAGLHSGSIMPPTMNRMVYLTLRGISVACLLLTIPDARPSIAEVHPGAALALRDSPIDAVRAFKHDEVARAQLLEWMESQGLRSVAAVDNPSDHYVAACAAALATWKWQDNDSAWLYPAKPPLHPFDYVC